MWMLAGCTLNTTVLLPVAIAPPAPPERGAGQARVRETTTTGVETPNQGGGSVYVPRVQLDGSIGIRLGSHFSLSVVGGSALDAGAYALEPGGRVRPERAAWYVGPAPTFHLALDGGRSQFALGIETHLLVMPIALADTSGCDLSPTPGCESRSEVTWFTLLVGGTFGASRWLSEHIRLRGFVSVRSQPTFFTIDEMPAPTFLGYAAITVGTGIEFWLTEWASFEAEAQWVLPIGPFLFYPTLSFSLAGTWEWEEGVHERDDPMFPDPALIE